MPSPEPTATARVRDARAMRALAHPTRLRLLGELRLRGPQSVGRLSELLDEAPGSVSYHVGKLAGAGLVEEAPDLAHDRRERWWRAVHATTTLEPTGPADDPEARAASVELRRSIAAGLAESLQRYLDQEALLPPEWAAAASSSDAVLHLTPGELTELVAELDALTERWQQRAGTPRGGTAPVVLAHHAYRRPE
ncbi:helix-turn-helix domain-containing protein [Kineococcus glutinatus]|uniref:Helix-turn-helix domain-containing protein n=1 Tax=Kineococcus glutinatus TaxID=1070872 RepID=A0ABP9H8S8_9ACTN